MKAGDQRKTQRYVLAFATLVTVDVYTLRQASLAPPAPVPVVTHDVAANDAEAAAEPDALAVPTDNAMTENAMATNDMTDDESAYVDPPETMDAPAEPEVTPQRAPVAAMAVPAPVPAQDPLAGVVTNALAKATR